MTSMRATVYLDREDDRVYVQVMEVGQDYEDEVDGFYVAAPASVDDQELGLDVDYDLREHGWDVAGSWRDDDLGQYRAMTATVARREGP